MFIPRDPATLSVTELVVEINHIDQHIQDLTWLEVHLQDIIVDIDTVLPVYKSAGANGELLNTLETAAGMCMRALHKIGRRQLTIRDQRAVACSFLEGASDANLADGLANDDRGRLYGQSEYGDVDVIA